MRCLTATYYLDIEFVDSLLHQSLSITPGFILAGPACICSVFFEEGTKSIFFFYLLTRLREAEQTSRIVVEDRTILSGEFRVSQFPPGAILAWFVTTYRVSITEFSPKAK